MNGWYSGDACLLCPVVEKSREVLLSQCLHFVMPNNGYGLKENIQRANRRPIRMQSYWWNYINDTEGWLWAIWKLCGLLVPISLFSLLNGTVKVKTNKLPQNCTGLNSTSKIFRRIIGKLNFSTKEYFMILFLFAIFREIIFRKNILWVVRTRYTFEPAMRSQ